MKYPVQNDRWTLRRWAALCAVLVLVVFATTLEVHAHAVAGAGSNDSHCSLCIASHSVAAPAQLTVATVTFAYCEVFAAAEPQLHSRLLVTSSFIRPPPQSL
jgi:hypothetical protein